LKKYTYDNFGRVSSMKYYNSDSDTVKESYTYTYDKNSNIKSESIVNNYPTKDSDKVDEKRSYEYDKLNRLINSDIVNNKTNKTESYAYEYDKVGNMISKSNILSDTNNITDYTYNDLNQLVSSETSNLSTEKTTSKKTYSYDENGNNIKEVDSIKNITKEMTYDVDNRMDTYTQTENNKTTTQSNLYNGDGQRIQKTEGDNSINYYYQNGNVLYTTDKDEKKTSHNFVGLEGNTISTMRYNISGLEYYVYNKDVKGSTTNIVDNNKNAKISYKYSDFGETREIGDTDFYNEIAYTGGIYDESTSLYYLNARYYNPEDARFITQDTYRGEVNNPSSLHLYAYCANDPINYIDPSGHSKWRYGGYGIQVAISIPFIDLALDIVWFSRNVKGFNTSSPYKAHAYICASGGGINKNDVLEKIIKNPSSLMKPSSVKNLLKKFPKINKVISRVGISLYYFHFGINKSYKTYKDYQGLGGAVNATFLHASAFGAIANGQITAGIGVSTSTFGLSFSFSKSVFHEGLTRNARSIGKTIMNYISKQSEKQWKKYYNKHK